MEQGATMKAGALAVVAGGVLLGACAMPDSWQAAPGTAVPGMAAAASPAEKIADKNPRADFLKLIDRPKVAANVQVKQGFTTGELTQIAFSFDSEKGQNV